MKYIHVFLCTNCREAQVELSDLSSFQNIRRERLSDLTGEHFRSTVRGTTNFLCGRFEYFGTYEKRENDVI